MPGQRIIPYQGLDLDSSLLYLKPKFARFLKNLVYVLNDTSQVGTNQPGNSGVFKPFESNGKFDISFVLPSGENQCIGYYVSKDTSQVIFLNWNSQNNHAVYIIDGESQTIQKCYQKDCLNLIRQPQHFLHEGGATLEIFDFTDPDTGLPRRRSYWMYTDGSNYQKFICLEDSIATNSFDASQYPYFVSGWEQCDFINCGVPTPDCPSIEEVPNDNPALPNFLKFNTWQFRVQYVDVYGRPSEWGKISDLYIPGINDCINSSNLLSRCVDLIFNAGSPFIDKINVAFRNCNDEVWNQDTTLFLYKGSCLGDWWKRERNTDINYNPEENTITYRFCKDKDCIPIAVEETNRTQNPMPRQSQSLSKIGNVVGMANNKDGFNPVNINDVSVVITPPSNTGTGTANIEIYVPIINVFTQTYQPVYTDDHGRIVWGGHFTNENRHVEDLYESYGQHFGTDTQAGFIGYLAATGTTPNSAVSEMYYVNDVNEFVKLEDYNIVFNPPYANRRFYNKFTFSNVAKAVYKFRIASHLAKTTDDNFSGTSTFVFGSFPWNNKQTVFNNNKNVNFGAVDLAKELTIDVCGGDYNSLNDTKVLAIFDLTHPGVTGSNKNKALNGYVYEKNDPLTGDNIYPVELLNVTGNKSGNSIYLVCKYTDHNGFYFTSDGANDYFCEIFGNCGCNNYKKLLSFGSGSTPGNNAENFFLQVDGDCSGGYADKLCSRSKITGKVTLCNSNIPVPGVGIVYSRGGTAITGADGTFTIIAHPNNTSANQTRSDYIYFVPTICPYVSCDNTCLQPIQVVIVPCSTCTERVFEVAEQRVQFNSKRGALSGGRYGVAIELEDWLGRHTFAQTKDSMYITMPTIIETHSFDPSTISIVIPPTVTFPSYFKKINFLVTKELSLEDYITWIIDKIEFIDNTGNVNDISPTQIKLYYGSLVEYNSQNNFNTTTGWQFEDTAVTPAINYTSDYVEFYVNGNGQFFPTLIRALIKYDKTGQYFLIDYDTALKDLVKYAQVRLCRPSQCNNENLFFQLCGSVDIVNGQAQVNTIPLNIYDTYLKYRQIPVPIGTLEEPENVPVTLGIPFEHHSPSDLWGYRCINIGRPNARNPYECEIIRQNQIALSGVLTANGQLNYLNYFDEAQKTNFDSWDFQGIVSMIWETAIGLIICQNNNFTLGYNDNIVRVNEAGQIIIPSAADKFGKPNVKIGNNYGCTLFDKNTIRSWQGLIQYLDTREGVLIQHDYNDANPVSLANPKYGVEAGIDSWLRPKIAYVKEWNKTHDNKKYFIGSIDPAAKSYNLTDFTIGSDSFVNEQREIVIEEQETIVFDIYNKIWRCFVGFTAEMYAYLQSDSLNQQYFAFQNGVPYKHYTVSATKTYNTFFGIKCNRVFRVVSVNDAFQKKIWQNITLISKTLWFSDKILTDSNQETRILKAGWKKGDFYFSAAIPANILTISDTNLPFRNANKLFEGDLMYGSYLDIRLIGDPDLDDIYSELFGIIVDMQPDEKILGG
jgi:hypothetical protein